jgi:DNA polymerase-3 subunit delta'
MKIVRPLGHAEQVRGLWAAAARGRLPHALLFAGPPGIGKWRAAGWFAAGLLCARGPGEPCGACGPCRRVSSGGDAGSNHADLFALDPLDLGLEQIPVAAISERSGATYAGPVLLPFLRLAPLESARRACLIRAAERLNPEAQNALLKTLEEPALGTVIVLVADRPERLLPTIRSRAVRLDLAPLGPSDVREVLRASGVDAGRAAELAAASGGSPGEALRLDRERAFDVDRVLGRLVAGALSPRAAFAELAQVEGEFEGAKAGALARARARLLVERAARLVQAEEQSAAALPGGGEPLPAELCAGVLERLAGLRQDIERNLAPEAATDRLLRGLARLAAGRRGASAG